MRNSLSMNRIHPTLHPPALSSLRWIHESSKMVLMVSESSHTTRLSMSSSSIAFVPYALQSQKDNNVKTVDDLERKKRKEEKARLKELKKQKAAERAASAKLMAPQEVGNASKKSAKKNVKKDAGEDKPEDYIYPETPLGEKKRLSRQMAKWYNPTAVEKSWYEWWEKSQFFVADANSSKPPFVIVSFPY
ncbi:hypothetical protein CRG98_024898 [Punica granatum]|uniref:valine--tRNA ligase n=1 Tax=Punica granatum TaxID=22663 RepID=A0A2I0JEL9_PUNGR|nr:hypothetical protein CRG98_024898 [Punica granatum]